MTGATIRVHSKAGLLVAGAALAQLGIWLVVRPDLAGPQWTEGRSLETWLALEAVAAVLIGCLAGRGTRAVRSVVVGWALQALHFAVLGEHYDDTLWGVGLFGQVVCAGAASALALLAHQLVRRGRGRADRLGVRG